MNSGKINPSDFRLEEYKALRTEIANKQSSIQRIILAAVAANFAIYSFSLNRNPAEFPLGWLVALVPSVVSAVACAWITTNVRSCNRIADYIRDHIESEVGDTCWETKIAKKRSGRRKQGLWRLILDPSKMVGIFLLFIGGSPCLSIWLLANSGIREGFMLWCGAIVALVVTGVSIPPIWLMVQAFRD